MLKKFGIYREPRRTTSQVSWSRPRPTRVEVVVAESPMEAAGIFLKNRPDGGGWHTASAIIELRDRRRSGVIYVRRFTPTGRYKGETKFLVWPL